MNRSGQPCTTCGQVGHEARAHDDAEAAIVMAAAALRDGDLKRIAGWLQIARKAVRAERQARIDRDRADEKRGLELEREYEEVFGP